MSLGERSVIVISDESGIGVYSGKPKQGTVVLYRNGCPFVTSGYGAVDIIDETKGALHDGKTPNGFHFKKL